MSGTIYDFDDTEDDTEDEVEAVDGDADAEDPVETCFILFDLFG